MSSQSVETKTVVIVGGGLAGLSAAFRLTLQKDANLSFVVLEADSRFGGRTITRGCDRDMGAGYVGQAQNCIQFLIRAFDIKTISTHLPKDKAWLYHHPDGERVEAFPGDNPLEFPGVPNAKDRLGELDLLSLEVKRVLQEPWKHPMAADWDSKTVADFIEERRELFRKGDTINGMSPETEAIFTASVRAAFSLDPDQISFYFLLYYAACAGSYSALVDIAGGDASAEGTRLQFGTQDLVRSLVGAIGEGNIRRDAKVVEIQSYADGSAVVTTEDGRVFVAEKVIVAASPPVAGKIAYRVEPADDEKLEAHLEVCGLMAKSIGRTIKGFVRFKSAVWRNKGRPDMPPKHNGLSGYTLSMAPSQEYPIGWTLDNVWEAPEEHRNCSETSYSLMTFIGGKPAAEWGAPTTKEQRGVAVIKHLKKIFDFTDDDFFTRPPEKSYDELDWAKDHPGVPAPAAMMPPGILSNEERARALREPVGSIHWAASELAFEWCGYLNGAVESGFAAASEVLLALADLGSKLGDEPEVSLALSSGPPPISTDELPVGPQPDAPTQH